MNMLNIGDLAGMLGMYDHTQIATVERKNNMPIIKINKELFFENECDTEKCLLRIFKLINDAIWLHPIDTNIFICDIWEDGNDNKLIYTCYGYTKKRFKKSAYYSTYKKYEKYIKTSQDVILFTPREYLTFDMYSKAKNRGYEDEIEEYKLKNPDAVNEAQAIFEKYYMAK